MRVLDFDEVARPDWEAAAIGQRWNEYNTYRLEKIKEWTELRNYLFATDTHTTTNKRLPWSNSTTTPKLTQIRDNLHANYMANLIPHEDFFTFEPADRASNVAEKKTAIKNYIRSKIRASGYKDTVSRLVLDWVDTGNCFAIVDHSKDIIVKDNGLVIPNYVGPVLRRISPYDIVFNPTAPSFSKTWKIVKELVTLGDVKKMIEEDPENEYLMAAFDDMVRVRGAVTEQDSEIHKSEGYIADGFNSITQYYSSGYVELLHFFGDIFNQQSGELQTNRIITIADRMKVVRNTEDKHWLGSNRIRHSGWRKRPDNLYGMSPLENLVGMQYRIDHLENMKADVWDQIAYPRMMIQGDVHEFGDDLGERIYLGQDGSVGFLAPDATALNADMQIQVLADRMEELAGAPRSAMGIRTPGEKTAFEVNTLQSGASRIFEHKALEFEGDMIDTTLNDYLAMGRQYMGEAEEIMYIDPQFSAPIFQLVSPEDITANGELRAKGAKSAADRQRRVGNITNLHQIKMSDPSVSVHISGKEVARILAEELGENSLFGDNIALVEQAETARLQQEIQMNVQEEQQVALEEGL